MIPQLAGCTLRDQCNEDSEGFGRWNKNRAQATLTGYMSAMTVVTD